MNLDDILVNPYALDFEKLSIDEQSKLIEELLNKDIKEDDRKKILVMVWRECDLTVKEKCDSKTYSKIIEIMKNEPKKLSIICMNTPESIQMQNKDLLKQILEYVIDDTKRFLAIWKNTSEEVKKEYPEVYKKIHILEQLGITNIKIQDTINLRILDDKYTSTLKFEQLQMITNYPQEQQKLLSLTDNQYNILNNALSGIEDIQQWRYEYNQVMSNIQSYEDLIEDISQMPDGKVNYQQVLNVLHQKNYFNIHSYKDATQLDKTKERLYHAVKNGEDTSDYSKQFILLEYLYNLDIEQAKTLIQRYSGDLQELSVNDENVGLQKNIEQIQKILSCTDEKEIVEFFNNPEYKKTQLDGIKLEQQLKKAYANEYNMSLTQLEDMQVIDEDLQTKFGLQDFKVYNAGTDFDMLISSVAPYNSNYPENFCDDWNRKETVSQGFCCSYIRNDMLGHAPVPHLCYGFSNMSPESLILSSVDDMGSDMSNGLVEEVAYNNVKFYSPNHQIDAVYDEGIYGFNEMVYNRIQNGSKKQPDYVIAFMRQGKIPNIDIIKRAVEQYKEKGIELPIVIIDEDRCIESEKAKINDMIQTFSENPSPELFMKIKQKIKNNTVANQMEFTEYSSYLTSSYEWTIQRMQNKKEKSQQSNDMTSLWMKKCKKWYEMPYKLPDKIKDHYLQIKRNITHFIKSRINQKDKEKENNIEGEQRDE